MRVIYFDGTMDEFVDTIEFSTDGKQIILDGTKCRDLITVVRIAEDRIEGHII